MTQQDTQPPAETLAEAREIAALFYDKRDPLDASYRDIAHNIRRGRHDTQEAVELVRFTMAYLATLTRRAGGDASCKAAPDHADIMETIQNAADDWQKKGYATALAEVRDMANVGRALMEALPEGYSYMDCPSEIVSDLQNERDDAVARAGGDAIPAGEGLTANSMDALDLVEGACTPMKALAPDYDPLNSYVTDNLPRWILDGWTSGNEQWEAASEAMQEMAENAARSVADGIRGDMESMERTPKPPAGGDVGAQCGWCRDFPDSERCECAALALPAPVVEGDAASTLHDCSRALRGMEIAWSSMTAAAPEHAQQHEAMASQYRALADRCDAALLGGPRHA